MLILQYNERHFDLLDEYLAEMPEVDEIDTKDEAYRELKKKWRKTFRELLNNEGIIKAFVTLNDPLEGIPRFRRQSALRGAIADIRVQFRR